MKIELFEFHDQPMRVVVIEEEPWWVAVDVCRALEIGNATESLRNMDDDDLSNTEVIDSLGRSQKVNVINESGLYTLIFASRKEMAREFKRWVTKEVLPAIRRNGRYALGSCPEAEPPRTIGEALLALTCDAARARAMVLDGTLSESAAQVASSPARRNFARGSCSRD